MRRASRGIELAPYFSLTSIGRIGHLCRFQSDLQTFQLFWLKSQCGISNGQQRFAWQMRLHQSSGFGKCPKEQRQTEEIINLNCSVKASQWLESIFPEIVAHSLVPSHHLFKLFPMLFFSLVSLCVHSWLPLKWLYLVNENPFNIHGFCGNNISCYKKIT